MSQKKPNQKTSASSNAATKTAASYGDSYPTQRMAQNYLLIWVDAGIDQTSKEFQNTLEQLQSVVSNVKTLTEPAQCVQFLNTIDQEKVFVITSGSLGQQLVPDIHAMPQLDAIYIFCGNKSRHEQWTKKWSKIKGIHTEMKPICEALQLAVKQFNQDSIAMSFVTVSETASAENLDQLEPNFMYTQIFKEILLEMEHKKQAIKDLAVYCRELYRDNQGELDVIEEFERKYRPELAIWWYTRECFTYNMLNRALRTLEADTIITMGFFIRDLHEQIQDLHQQKVSGYKAKTFKVYRGQGLLKTDFEKLLKTKGGLMSFNNFLSTSTKREVSLGFARGALTKTDTVGILFVMCIDPSVSSTPFAAIEDDSYFKTEEEILFSMHTVFRVGEIKQLDNNNRLYQVDLQLTADDDEQLRILTKRIGEEVNGDTGWKRLGQLLLKIGQLDKAEEIYKVLLEQTSDEGGKGKYYNQLGYIKDNQGDYEKAFEYYGKSLEIRQRTLPANHPSLATSYNNIGVVYVNMGEYSKAVSFYEKSIEIQQKSLPANHPSLATSYNNIGEVYRNMGEYSKALSFYEKTREIFEKTLPANHPDLATSYNNIGVVHMNMGEYSKAVSLYEKSLEIQQKTLLANHPDLATSYDNIGLVYMKMGEYSKALSFYEKELEIQQKILPANHPDLATSYGSIGLVCIHMGEYSKALSYFEPALNILKISLPANHPDLKKVNLIIENVRKKL